MVHDGNILPLLQSIIEERLAMQMRFIESIQAIVFVAGIAVGIAALPIPAGAVIMLR
jgi:hypothetical protein